MSIMVSSRIKEIYLDCLALAPVNKILAGTDGHTVPEMHWYGATMTYKGIGDALSHLISESFIDSDLAIQYAKKVLGQNANLRSHVGSHCAEVLSLDTSSVNTLESECC